METKFYEKQSVAKGLVTKMNKTAPDGIVYKLEPLGTGFIIVEHDPSAPKKRGPKPGPSMTQRALVPVIRNHAAAAWEAGDMNWPEVLDWTDDQIIKAMGRSKKPSGAIWAVEQTWAA